jgi:hypothetical protein
MSTSIFRVRFTEWQAFGKDVPADTAEHAIELAQAIRDSRGTFDFEELDGGTENWEAERIPLRHEEEITALQDAAKLALRALNTARKFRVGDTDSYAIASQVGKALDALKGGGR